MNQLIDQSPKLVNINVALNLQQADINLHLSINPEIPFNIFINGLAEALFANRMAPFSEGKTYYQLGNDQMIQFNESRTLKRLGFFNNCTLYIGHKGLNPSLQK